jgi:two-component system response regulator HydG
MSDLMRILFASKDPDFTKALIRFLGSGFDVDPRGSFALDADAIHAADAILLDLHTTRNDYELPSALRLLEQVSKTELPPPVIVILETRERTATIDLLEKGAYEVLASPPNLMDLRTALERGRQHHNAVKEAARLRAQQLQPRAVPELIATSSSMSQMLDMARRIAPCDVSVLITGETGTGKELVARMIHRLSPRAPYPIVAFSCANLPDTLVEDELFGHEKGAFTGAQAMRCGRLEAADRGTLFLDEVGDLGIALQPKLLRVLQERNFERLGSNRSVSVNLRVVCATNRELAKMVEHGKFREDLYYRLNVVQLHVPPLRERRDDIPLLANHFLRRFAEQFQKNVTRMPRSVMHALEEHLWPGNVRELENVIQRAVALADGPSIELWHLPATLRTNFGAPAPIEQSYEGEVREFKRRLIVRTLNQCGGSKTRAARNLGVARNYLHRLINQYQIRSADDDNGTNGAKGTIIIEELP